jgi:hypothetical protein
MLTRLKTYLHELVSDKKNWLILLPAIALLDLGFSIVSASFKGAGNSVDHYQAMSLTNIISGLGPDFVFPGTFNFCPDKASAFMDEIELIQASPRSLSYVYIGYAAIVTSLNIYCVFLKKIRLVALIVLLPWSFWLILAYTLLTYPCLD